MSGEGYVRLYRRALDSWLWTLPPQRFRTALTILLLANWKDGEIAHGETVIRVPRGSFVTSLDALAARSCCSKSQLRSTLRLFEKVDFIRQKSTNRFRVITVINYESYQPGPGEVDKRTDTRTNRRTGTRTDNRTATDRRREEGKKGRKIQYRAVAEYFFEGFNRYFGRRCRPEAWLDDIGKAVRAGYTQEQMRGAAWGAWQSCAGSPEVLRNFKPSTVLRLKSREGKTTLPQWLERAEELWREQHGAKPAPWHPQDEQPELGSVVELPAFRSIYVR